MPITINPTTLYGLTFVEEDPDCDLVKITIIKGRAILGMATPYPDYIGDFLPADAY